MDRKLDQFNSVQLNYKLNDHNWNLGLSNFSHHKFLDYKSNLWNIRIKADPHAKQLLSKLEICE